MSNKSYKLSMRAAFAQSVHNQMARNDKVWVIVNDLGYKMWDKVRKDFSKRFINVGAAEQTLIGVSIGLALQNNIPIVYSITTFLLYRPFEAIRNYINHEKIPVKLIGSGRNKDYYHDGVSHWAEEDKKLMSILKNINAIWPQNIKDIPDLVEKMITSKDPWYINLRR